MPAAVAPVAVLLRWWQVLLSLGSGTTRKVQHGPCRIENALLLPLRLLLLRLPAVVVRDPEAARKQEEIFAELKTLNLLQSKVGTGGGRGVAILHRLRGGQWLGCCPSPAWKVSRGAAPRTVATAVKAVTGAAPVPPIDSALALLRLMPQALRVRRIYDEKNGVLIYVAYTTRFNSANDEGERGFSSRYRSSVCAVPVARDAPALVDAEAAAQ